MHEDDGAHETLVLDVPNETKVEAVWREYWAPLLRDGGIARLKGELYDAHFLVDQARKVYRHITGGVMDDLTASADGVIAMAERVTQQRMEKLQERVAELEAELMEARR